MIDDLRARLLGDRLRDPGCDACFEVLEQYVEAAIKGEDLRRRFPEVVAHVESCAACREDTEGLLAIIRLEPPPDEPR